MKMKSRVRIKFKGCRESLIKIKAVGHKYNNGGPSPALDFTPKPPQGGLHNLLDFNKSPLGVPIAIGIGVK
jgi:hypothetical protein